MDSGEGAAEVDLRIQFRVKEPVRQHLASSSYDSLWNIGDRWFPEKEFGISLRKFLEEWKGNSQLVPVKLFEDSSELVKRRPETLEVAVLAWSTVYAMGYVVQILDFILNSDNELDRGAIFNEVAIESLEYGSVTGKIFLNAAFAVNLFGSLLTVNSTLFKNPSHKLVVPISAECSIYAREEEKLAELILQKLNSSPESFIDQANKSCVQLRQQAINHFVDQPIAVDGLYGDDTMYAEDRIRGQLGIENNDILLLYRGIAEVLMRPRLNIEIPSDVRRKIKVTKNSLLSQVYPRNKPDNITFRPK
ncbi:MULTISPECIES: hypothetical protein [unclassified Thalassospira]|uniref:hypothetical protein n=1 Tax=unclassified Thalassospira TaxID=2648997 RepID=UPI0007A56E17|nr:MULTISPECIES: hypothetical protein [unclassified Thalassospira]KZD01374.1 hypothetical protein AUQ41_19450 [Thalassospira sp. MCCC 1A02898]ONH88389.1 hypothetical protein TH47_11645 [Thalassospira sp. MCCC 1A02803]